MNTISVFKKQFTRKFGFPKKMKLNYEVDRDRGTPCSEEGEDNGKVSWDFGGAREVSSTDDFVLDSLETASCISVEEVNSQATQIFIPYKASQDTTSASNLYDSDQIATPIYVTNGSKNDASVPVYENASAENLLYENCGEKVSEENGAEEHIYEHVCPLIELTCEEIQERAVRSVNDEISEEFEPVNVFIGLLQEQGDAISPDPNIYEVPPGAIINSIFSDVVDSDIGGIGPPRGFQDYENVSWVTTKIIEAGEELPLPFEAVYSSVVKPKRKKQRIPLFTLLQREMDIALTEKSSETQEKDNFELNLKNEQNITPKYENDELHENNVCDDKNLMCPDPKEERTMSLHAGKIDTENDLHFVLPDVNFEEMVGNDEYQCTNSISKITMNGTSDQSMRDATNIPYKEEGPGRGTTWQMNQEQHTGLHVAPETIQETPYTAEQENFSAAEYSTKEDTFSSLQERVKAAVSATLESERTVSETSSENIVQGNDGESSNLKSRNTSKKNINITEHELNKHSEQDIQDSVTICSQLQSNVDNLIEDIQDLKISVNIDDNAREIRTSDEDHMKYSKIEEMPICETPPVGLNKIPSLDLAKMEKLNTEDNSFISDLKEFEESKDSLEVSKCDHDLLTCLNKIKLEDDENLHKDKEPCELEKHPELSVMKMQAEILNKSCESKETSAVIEISEDGSWETRTLPGIELEEAKESVQDESNAALGLQCKTSMLSPETVKIEHAALTYGSQYYVNSPVVSVKPRVLEESISKGEVSNDCTTAEVSNRNEGEIQKIYDVPHSPEANMLDIEKERRRIIDNQTVRAKKRNSWIRNGQEPKKSEASGVEELESSNLKCGVIKIHSNLLPLSDADVKTSVLAMENLSSVNAGNGQSTMASAASNLESGEVVCDSILLNKHKTKSYWEQLMMAAVTSEQSYRTQYHTSDGVEALNKTKDLSSLSSDGEDSKPHSELSEQEYYDARSQVSLSSPSEPLDSLDVATTTVAGPKIVESVAKKLLAEAEATTQIKSNSPNHEESVIEKEIRLQKQKEEALAKERQEAMSRAAIISQQMPTPTQLEQRNRHAIVYANTLGAVPPNAETKIALELREMREREEELRRQRQKMRLSNGGLQTKEETGQTADDGFNSFLTTDEGNVSEYGSEEKETSLDGNNSRMTSPEVPVSFNQRTQSMESMSSSYSSGSGEITGYSTRRRVTVKPLDEPEEEDVPVYMRNWKETPIEREIRLAREREEELRREKSLLSLNSQSTVSTIQEFYKEKNKLNVNNIQRAQHKLSTSHIQQEINEASQREKELHEVGMIQTTSEETVASKEVTCFTDLPEFAVEEKPEDKGGKLQKSVSVSNIPSTSIELGCGAHSLPALVTANSTIIQKSPQSTITSIGSKKFPSSLSQKGLMQRFIASRGRINGIVSSIVPSSPVASDGSSHTTITAFSKVTDKEPEETSQNHESDRGGFDVQKNQSRRGYVSAEEKIQVELREMQKREEELRLQRARLIARSQPNLLCLGEDEEEGQETTRITESETPLRSSLSNPNLLDSEMSLQISNDLSHVKPSGKTLRRRSALIAQWENRIQKYSEH